VKFPFGTRVPLLGWYGKLPAVGDFSARGLDGSLLTILGDWCAQGMETISTHNGGEDWREAYMLSPVWSFVMNAEVWSDEPLAGCMAPSVDRVGRCYPLIIVRSIINGELGRILPPRNDWLQRADMVIRQAVSGKIAVDDVMPGVVNGDNLEGHAFDTGSTESILNELGISDGGDKPSNYFSWPELNTVFYERPGRSFWWAEPSPKQPPRQIIHAGNPDAQLFSLLMGGWIKS
jgi:type VI secretion system protein ImpM